MSDFYFGKISKNYDPVQLTNAYYKAAQNSTWFNGLKTGDYVLMIGGDKVQFWQAKKYNVDRMEFKVLLNDCGIKPKQLSSLAFFELNMELIIKSMRSTTSEKKAFYKLKPLDQYKNLDGLLRKSNTYQNPAYFRKIILYAAQAELNKDIKNHDNDIQLFYDNGILKIQSKPFIDKQLASQFNGDLSGIRGDRKDKIVDKFNLNGLLKKDIDISMRDLYDVVFSSQKPKSKNNTGNKGMSGNGTLYAGGSTTMTGSATKISETPLNQILYGPPGTGKTYNTLYYALSIIEGKSIEDLENDPYEDLKERYYGYVKDKRIFFTTFHQSMSYEDFIEGIKPETSGGAIKYDKKPGIFKELCKKAEVNYRLPYVLIIDEINRGNVSQIFGELITLIEKDKRVDIELKKNGTENGLTVRLPYSPNEEFYVPCNIYIIGTMNTADRSVEALDTALRRRFKFVEMMPKPELLNVTVAGVLLKDVLETINQRIIVLKDREHQIGHSYFMSKGKPIDNPDDLKDAFKDKIVPLLQEYFYGNYNNIGLVLGKEFVVKENNTPTFAEGFEYDGVLEQSSCKLLTEKGWKELNMEDALKALIKSN